MTRRRGTGRRIEMALLRRAVDACLDHPRLVLGLFLALTLGWGLTLSRLHLETDGRSLLPPDHPALLLQAAVDDTYASSDFLVVGIAAREGEIFTPAALNWVLRTSEAIEALPGVAAGEVRSLSTLFSPAWEERGLRLEPPLRQPIATPAEAAAVKAAAGADPLFPRVLHAADGRGAAIYVALEAGADRQRLVHRIAELAAAELARFDPDEAGRYRLHLLGPAAAETLLGEHVLRDLATLLPLALVAVAALLWLWFRQLSVVAVGLGEAAAVVMWALGLMGALGKGISLVTVVMPVILATYCVADTIHIAQRFREKCGERGPGERRTALGEALDELLQPMVFTSLTTCAGFLSFWLSPIPPLRDFGLFSGFGILCALGVSLLVVPPALLLGGFGRGRRSRDVPTWAGRRLAAVTLGAARRPAVVVALTLGLCLLSGAGLLRLRIQDSWVDNFGPDSALVRSDRWFNDSFYGSNVVNLVLDRGRPGAAFEPRFLESLERLQGRLGSRPSVGGSLSLSDQLRAVGRALERSPTLPRNRPEAEEWALLVRMAGGSGSLDPYVDPDGSAANLWVFVNRADYQKTAGVMQAVADFAWPDGERPQLSFAGDAYLGYLLVGLIAASLRVSLLGALVVNLLVVGWMLRSASGALLVILPVALAVLWNFGLMGWGGISLGVATSTFSAIALGIGIDFALHWRAKLQLLVAAGEDWAEALARTAVTAGGAILLNGAVLLAGFAILLFSSTPPNQRLGVLISINLVVCLVATLVLLPAAATLLRRPASSARAVPVAGRSEVVP